MHNVVSHHSPMCGSPLLNESPSPPSPHPPSPPFLLPLPLHSINQSINHLRSSYNTMAHGRSHFRFKHSGINQSNIASHTRMSSGSLARFWHMIRQCAALTWFGAAVNVPSMACYSACGWRQWQVLARVVLFAIALFQRRWMMQYT